MAVFFIMEVTHVFPALSWIDAETVWILETDIIVGKIADDQTARTLQLYISEYFGNPGTKEADDAAIKQLLPNRLQDQLCFRTEDSVSSLQFVRSERYGNCNG